MTPRTRGRRALALTSTAALIAAAVLGVASPAAADDTPQQTVRWTKIGIYPRVGPSMSDGRAGAAVSDGTVVTVYCEVEGQPVTSDVVTDDRIWASTNIGWLPNAFLDSGFDGRTPNVRDCNSGSVPVAPAPDPVAPAPPSDPAPAAPSAPEPSAPEPAAPAPAPIAPDQGIDAGYYGVHWTGEQVDSSEAYDRQAVGRWALEHFGTWNGDYGQNDCTQFVSTMLHEAAGWAHTDSWTDSVPWWNGSAAASGWWIFGSGPGKDYVSADHFKNWIQNVGYATIDEVTDEGRSGSPLPSQAQVGDIVQFDFHDEDGVPGADGAVDHTMVVVGFQGDRALVVGVDSYPADANGDAVPAIWYDGTVPGQSFFDRNANSRAYLLHVTR